MVSRHSIADREAKARACDEAIRSRTLARSQTLVQFLRYICDQELDGRGPEITEYSIATGALHRPADYSPGEDSSVRSRAHALRRKLQEYYEVEAPDAEIRIELPKGSYRPVFVHRDDAPTHPMEPVPVLELHPPEPNPKRKWLAVLAIAAVILIAGILWYRTYRPDPIDPLVRAAWGPILQRGSDVLILVSAPPVMRTLPSQPGVRPPGNFLEPAPEWAARWYKGLNLEDRGGPIYLAPNRGYSVFSDSVAAMSISSMIGIVGGSYHVMPESDLQPRAIHEAGVVVIGSPSYTTYLDRILKTMSYSFWFDPATNLEALGQRAKPGSPIYQPKRNPQTTRYSTVYGLITVLPSQPGKVRPERTLVFAGFMGSPGAQAAIDYFRSPAALRDLEQRFQQQGYGTFPPAYQVVVRCAVDRETAINAVYETHVVIDKVPLIE